MVLRKALIATVILILAVSVADAKPHKHHHRHHYRHHRGYFVCGLVQRLHFGLPPQFNLALHWATLPHTSPHPGAVVVQRRKGRAIGGGPGGHVSRIVSMTGQCTAIVADDKGTYERNICRNLVAYVEP